MKKLYIKVYFIIITLLAVSVIPTTASAHSYFWWERPRRAIVTKDTTIYKVKLRFPRYRSYAVKSHVLKRGAVITTHHMASYDWSVEKPGYTHNSHFIWVMDRASSPTWITPYSKYWVVWRKPMSQHQYIPKHSHVTIYTKPGGKKSFNLTSHSHTILYARTKEKIKSGALYYYVTNKSKKIKGWIWHGYLKRYPGEKILTESINTANLSESAYAVKNKTAVLYNVINGSKKARIQKLAQHLLIASKTTQTYKNGDFLFVTDSKNKFSGWVAAKSVESDYTLIFKYANWKPFHTADDASSNYLEPPYHQPTTARSNTYLRIGENVLAQKYDDNQVYMIKRRNGQLGFYDPQTTDNMVAGYIFGKHNAFIHEENYQITKSKTPMYDNYNDINDTVSNYNLLGYIPSNTKVYLISIDSSKYELVSYNDILVEIPTSSVQ